MLFRSRATAVHPYPDEQQLNDGDPRLLAQLAEATGGRSDSTVDDWLDTGGQARRGERPLWPDVLRAALLLLVLDVALRRIRLGKAKAARWHDLRG